MLEHRFRVVHRFARVVDDRKIFILDAQCARAGVRGLLGFADNERDAIAIEAHDLFAEQRLIGDHEAVAIVGHVFSGEHRHNTGHSQRSALVDSEDARVCTLRKDHFQAQMFVTDEIGRILCRAGYFPARVGTWERSADHTRASAFAASLASIIASRILR